MAGRKTGVAGSTGTSKAAAGKLAEAASFEDVMRLGQERGVAENPLFISAAQTHESLARAIDLAMTSLTEEGVLTTKQYGNGSYNTSANPMIKELSKLADARNKIIKTMMDIIERMGVNNEPDELMSFIGGE